MCLSVPPFLIPLWLQSGRGWTAFKSGMMTTCVLGGAIVSKRYLPYLTQRFSVRQQLIGNSLGCIVPFVSFALLSRYFSLTAVIITYMIMGFFISNQFTMMNNQIYRQLDNTTLSAGTTVNSMIMQLAMSFGISLAALFMVLLIGNNHLSHHIALSVFHWTFLFEISFMICGMVVFLKATSGKVLL